MIGDPSIHAEEPKDTPEWRAHRDFCEKHYSHWIIVERNGSVAVAKFMADMTGIFGKRYTFLSPNNISVFEYDSCTHGSDRCDWPRYDPQRWAAIEVMDSLCGFYFLLYRNEEDATIARLLLPA